MATVKTIRTAEDGATIREQDGGFVELERESAMRSWVFTFYSGENLKNCPYIAEIKISDQELRSMGLKIISIG